VALRGLQQLILQHNLVVVTVFIMSLLIRLLPTSAPDMLRISVIIALWDSALQLIWLLKVCVSGAGSLCDWRECVKAVAE
jgi:hypothetical protein